MIDNNDINKFKKMWKWLIVHPDSDCKYYTKRVLQLELMWVNECPLSTSKHLEKCSGCQDLWDSLHGNLCTDPNSPLYRWKNTERSQLDRRSFYASHILELAKKFKHESKQPKSRWSSHRKTALGEPLPTTNRHQWIAW